MSRTTARQHVIRSGHQGVEAVDRATRKVEKKLAKHGFSAQQIQDILADSAEQARDDLEKTREDLGKRGRRARKELAKSTKGSRKELAKHTKRARKGLAATIEPGDRRKRRWPWMLVLAVGAAGAARLAKSQSRGN